LPHTPICSFVSELPVCVLCCSCVVSRAFCFRTTIVCFVLQLWCFESVLFQNYQCVFCVAAVVFRERSVSDLPVCVLCCSCGVSRAFCFTVQRFTLRCYPLTRRCNLKPCTNLFSLCGVLWQTQQLAQAPAVNPCCRQPTRVMASLVSITVLLCF
jgi:hypothetical protein